MENIPSSFIGYKKEVVDDIINQKNSKLSTQQKDINYLRNEINKLEKSIQTKNLILKLAIAP